MTADGSILMGSELAIVVDYELILVGSERGICRWPTVADTTTIPKEDLRIQQN